MGKGRGRTQQVSVDNRVFPMLSSFKVSTEGSDGLVSYNSHEDFLKDKDSIIKLANDFKQKDRDFSYSYSQYKSKSLDELDDIASKQGVRIKAEGQVHSTGVGRTLAFDEKEHKNFSIQADVILSLNEKFKNLGYSSISAINSGATSRATDANAFYSPSDKSITTQLSRKDSLESQNLGDMGDFHATGKTTWSTASHEYGHHVHFALKEANPTLVAKYEKAVSNLPKVSDYAYKNKEEAFAENFACYVMGITPTRGVSSYKKFVKLMEDTNLTSLKGSIKPTSKAPTDYKIPESRYTVSVDYRSYGKIQIKDETYSLNDLSRGHTISYDYKTDTDVKTPISWLNSTTPTPKSSRTRTTETPTKTTTPVEKPTKTTTPTPKTVEKVVEKPKVTSTKTTTTKTTPTKKVTTATTKATTSSETKYNLGDTHTFTRGGKKQTVTFSATAINRGYATKTVEGKTYYIDLNGKVTSTAPKVTSSSVTAKTTKTVTSVKATSSKSTEATTPTKATKPTPVKKTTSTKSVAKATTPTTTSNAKYKSGDTHSFAKLGQTFSVTFTDADVKKGYKLKTIRGIKYKVDLNGNVVKV